MEPRLGFVIVEPSVLFCVCVRPSGPGRALQGGPAPGATPGGSEDLRKEATAQQTPHVPQNPDEDHRPP